MTYKDGNEWGNGTGKAKNWIGRQWDYNPELYPSEGAFVSKLGNLSMTYGPILSALFFAMVGEQFD